jgi:hypothetical protein
MVRRFDDDASRPARGLQIWQILIGKAHNRQTITYGQLAKLLGFEGAGTMAHMLGHVYFYCQQKGLPPLNVLVVNQESGLPGEGVKHIDLNRSREEVFGFNWYGIWPPTPDELRIAFEEGMSGSAPSPT